MRTEPAPRFAALCTLLAVLGLPAPAQAKGAYEEALEAYQTALRAGSFHRRAWTRMSLAATGDVRGLEVLLEGYTRPEPPAEQVRYLVAQACGTNFRSKAAVPVFARRMQRHRDPEDAWLWFQGLRARMHAEGPASATSFVEGEASPWIRAAAIQAVGRQGTKACGAAVLPLVDRLPTAPLDRGLVLAALASAALAQKFIVEDRAVQDPELRALLERLIDAADAKETPDWARLACARRLSRLLDVDPPTSHAPTLKAALDGKAAAPASGDRPAYARPRFMGIEATGQRICYVIDLSDSMLTPLTDAEREDLRRPAITGGASARPRREPPPEDRLPWDRIRTRFDVAREYLKLSLAGLPKDASFAVVAFGTDARLLGSTPVLRRATKDSVAATSRELDGMKAGSRTADRPHGTLRGDTNLHAALRLAFRVTLLGAVKGPEYVAREGPSDGCDTVFLLSDGHPTADDWPGVEPGFSTGGFLDRESGRSTPGTHAPTPASLTTTGPYGYHSVFLTGEVERLNLFRGAEIHCVGIGEANVALLHEIAGYGLGQVRTVGMAK